MPITDFDPSNVPTKAPDDVDQPLLAGLVTGLSRVNRRFWIVGNFNAKPDSPKLFHFGPQACQKAYRDTPVLQDVIRTGEPGEDHRRRFLRLVPENTPTSFYDEVKPLVVERLTPTPGGSVVQTGAPTRDNEEGTTLHEVNSFFILFDGYRQAGQEADETQLGRSLLKRLGQALDGYLDSLTELDGLIVAFNEFLTTRDHAVKGLVLPGEGVKFHPNFPELFFGYLMKEASGLPFDWKALDWKPFEKNLGSECSEEDKKFFAADVFAFKTALLEDPTKANAVDPKLREEFQRRRGLILDAGKTVHTKLILSLLPLWTFRELLGKPPGKGFSQADVNECFARINGATPAERTVTITARGGAPEKVELAEPVRQLKPAMRAELRDRLEKQVTEAIEAWATGDAGAQQRILADLQTAGVSTEQVEKVKSGLGMIAAMVAQREAFARSKGSDPALARAAVQGVLRKAWLGALRGQYLSALVGEPVCHVKDIEDAIIADLQQLYIMAELSRDEIGAALLGQARAGRTIVSKAIDARSGELGGGLEAILPKLRAGFLVPVAGAMTTELMDNLAALDAYARVRAARLRAAPPAPVSGKHTTVSSGDRRLDLCAASVTPADVRDFAENEAKEAEKQPAQVTVEAPAGGFTTAARETASGAASHGAVPAPSAPAPGLGGSIPPASPAPGLGGPVPPTAPARGLAPDRKAVATLKDLIRLFEQRPAPAPAAPATPAPAGGHGPDGAEQIVAGARYALDLIWKTRKDKNTDPAFGRLCRRVALAELLLAKNQDLGDFGKDKSSLYQMALDLLAYDPDNLAAFFRDHSLTEYFDLKNATDLGSRYRRLQLQTREAALAMARYISEVRGVAELIKQLETELARDVELFLFNGTADEFLAWLERTRQPGGGQFWDPDNLPSTQFVRPGLIYVLESALPDPDPASTGTRSPAGQSLRQFLEALSKFDTAGPAHPLPLPPVLFSTTATAADDWDAPVREAADPNWPDLPCPFYFVGPAKYVKRGSLGQITKSAGFFVLEWLIRGKTSGDPIADGNDPADQVRSPQVISLARTRVSIDDAVRRLLRDGRVDTGPEGEMPILPPLEASMWLAQLDLLCRFLRSDGRAPNALEGEGADRFWRCFSWLDGIATGPYERRRKSRGDLNPALNVLHRFGRDNAVYSVRRDGDKRQVAVLKNDQVQAEATNNTERFYPTPWFKH